MDHLKMKSDVIEQITVLCNHISHKIDILHSLDIDEHDYCCDLMDQVSSMMQAHDKLAAATNRAKNVNTKQWDTNT